MAEMTKSEFVRSQPASMSPSDVVAAGVKRGIKLSRNLVYLVRSKGAKPVGRVARAPLVTARGPAAGVDSEIRARIDQFVAEIGDLARASVVDAVRESLEPGSAPSRRGPGRPRGSSAARRPKGAKRSPEMLARTTSRLFAAIKAKPGQRIEQLSEKLGASTKDLALPAKKLIAEKKVRMTGVKRATKYFQRG